MNLNDVAASLNAFQGSNYVGSDLLARPDLLRLGLLVRSASGETGGSSTTATLTSVAASATNVTLLAASSTRQRIIITNDSTQTLYIRIGGGAASIAAGGYSLVLTPKSVSPAMVNLDQAYGAHLAITGIWAAADATGFVNIVSFS